MMYLSLAFLASVIAGPAIVVAQVPTVPPTYEPTTTFPPTGTPTKAPVPAPVPFRPCYSNLTEVEDMVKLKNPFIVETYILCPDTIYEMGVVDPLTFLYTNGSNPIMTRSNSIYLCGEDGKSSNNCVIRGGEYHIFHEFITYNRENKVNVVIKGLTFDNASSGAIVLAAPGDITFIDCIFRNHENSGILPVIYSYVNTRRLTALMATAEEGGKTGRLARYYTELINDPVALVKFKADTKKSNNRRLQGGDILESQLVTVDGCLFEGNTLGPDGILTIDGMIAILSASNVVIVKNTIFQNNDFDDPINGANGYAISAPVGASVTVMDSCFINNKHIGAGVVVIDGDAQSFVSSGNFGSEDPSLECEFARVAGSTCVDFDATQCMAVNAFIAAPVPVAAPTADAGNSTDVTSGSKSIKFGSMFIAILLSLFAM